MRPFNILTFLLGVFILLATAMLFTPPDGVKLGEFTFHMPTFKEMLLEDEVEYADVSAIIENQFNIDSAAVIEVDIAHGDTIKEVITGASYDSLVSKIHKLEFAETGRKHLYRFFEKLENDSLTRMMHYGDSQIESDRMTAFIRNKLQLRFGGTGVGLRPALQPYDFIFSARQENSGDWNRYPLYGKIDSLVDHKKYGAMAAFSRYASLTYDSVPFRPSIDYRAELTISATSFSFELARKYEYFRMFYGNSKMPVQLRLGANGTIVLRDSLKANTDYAVVECDLPDTTNTVSLIFEGFDSPDIYGIELASRSGIIVDNIALRGSSGLFFTLNDFEHSQNMYNDLKPDLFLLQFGGNMVPYISEGGPQRIKNYMRRFRRQIRRIKQTCPDAAIIVIGPGDMSTKEKDRFVTYNNLPELVEAMKNVALLTGCGYWNMFDAMGGKNSMPSWVNAEPELARPDYVHFSNRGARLIANMFYNALIIEYNNFLNENLKPENKP
ncbi:MAG TPA: GDSL-type esterase/lipase family protein [Tangfeifania sp.]|nr:GDSL-type esterase/lipase family protein [Tangfeifania sp.]